MTQDSQPLRKLRRFLIRYVLNRRAKSVQKGSASLDTTGEAPTRVLNDLVFQAIYDPELLIGSSTLEELEERKRQLEYQEKWLQSILKQIRWEIDYISSTCDLTSEHQETTQLKSEMPSDPMTPNPSEDKPDLESGE